MSYSKSADDNSQLDTHKSIKSYGRLFGLLGKHGVIISFIMLTLFPFIWSLSTSFKLPEMILSYPPSLFPKTLTMQHYIGILVEGNYIRYTFNTLFVSVTAVTLSIIAALFAGFATARYEFIGKELVMFFMIAGMAIGKFANVIALYFFATRLNLFDTYLILILANSASVIPLLVWLFQGYFKSIPRELDEAAKMDGCTTWSAFWRILIPPMRPAIVAGAVVGMVNVWNEFILAMTLTRSPELRILSVAINFFMSETGVDWGQLTAASIIATIPIVIIVLALQKHFIQGLTSGTLASS